MLIIGPIGVVEAQPIRTVLALMLPLSAFANPTCIQAPYLQIKSTPNIQLFQLLTLLESLLGPSQSFTELLFY